MTSPRRGKLPPPTLRKSRAEPPRPAVPQELGRWETANWSAPLAFEDASIAYGQQGVWVVELQTLSLNAVATADHLVQTALARHAKGVVCELPPRLGGASASSWRALARVGLHVRFWPDTPVLIACRSEEAERRLRSCTGAEHLGFEHTALAAWSRLMRGPSRLQAAREFEPKPRALRAVRDFVRTTCHEWQQEELADGATLVANELATNAFEHAASRFEVRLTTQARDWLRVSVEDDHPAPPRPAQPTPDVPSGRGLLMVEHLSIGHGALPTPTGKLVWATIHKEEDPLVHLNDKRRPAV